ncbi:S1/P1 nuclease [Gelidibacter salicanalis]|uniref:S1/P1 nuclease n=1 Tax=Gelidibacter salicanalis TaxID=291193 RepID=A0A934KSM5_9FLAO|nr:S1/P1 nuclease [Gelidibacter salicanalis]MBJ7879978.1 S1/P1 nuclease [Gelidibacter salicanalis]
MKPISLLILTVALVFSTQSFSTKKWGATGHRVVGAIADNYTSNKTKRHLKKLLNNQSLAFVSTYSDDIKADPRFKAYDVWHYVNMSFDDTYETSKKNPEGDLVTAIAYCKRIITDDSSSDDDKAFHLKMLIHLIGDLHQPMHVGRAEDKGGNDIKLKWFYKDTNLHRVWDSQMIESYGMSYSELSENADHLSRAQVKYLQKDDVVDWVNETQHLTKEIYNSIEVGENLSYGYSYKYLDTARTQMQIAGIRLAKVLNDLF